METGQSLNDKKIKCKAFIWINNKISLFIYLFIYLFICY